ncbi:hypothetical protein KQX54_020091, partial [Cotesia glomerata]
QWFKFSINIQVFFDRSIFTSFVCQRWAIRKMRIVECREGGAGQMSPRGRRHAAAGRKRASWQRRSSDSSGAANRSQVVKRGRGTARGGKKNIRNGRSGGCCKSSKLEDPFETAQKAIQAYQEARKGEPSTRKYRQSKRMVL